MKRPQAALRRAIRLLGGYSPAARVLGIKKQSIFQWRVCPAERVVRLAAATRHAVRAEDLRPDVFPPRPKTKSRRHR